MFGITEKIPKSRYTDVSNTDRTFRYFSEEIPSFRYNLLFRPKFSVNTELFGIYRTFRYLIFGFGISELINFEVITTLNNVCIYFSLCQSVFGFSICHSWLFILSICSLTEYFQKVIAFTCPPLTYPPVTLNM